MDNDSHRRDVEQASSQEKSIAWVTRASSPLAWLGSELVGLLRPVLLALVFFLVVTPLGMLLRALRKDPLRLRRDVEARSYWVDRQPPGPAPDSLKSQF